MSRNRAGEHKNLVFPCFTIGKWFNDAVNAAFRDGHGFLKVLAGNEEGCYRQRAARCAEDEPTARRPHTAECIDLTILYSAFNVDYMDLVVIKFGKANEGRTGFFGEIGVVNNKGLAFFEVVFRFW